MARQEEEITMKQNITVCVGRQYGSGGREVGELVAKKLGVICYDKLLIQEAARKSGMNENFLEKNATALRMRRTWEICFILPEKRPTERRETPF